MGSNPRIRPAGRKDVPVQRLLVITDTHDNSRGPFYPRVLDLAGRAPLPAAGPTDITLAAHLGDAVNDPPRRLEHVPNLHAHVREMLKRTGSDVGAWVWGNHDRLPSGLNPRVAPPTRSMLENANPRECGVFPLLAQPREVVVRPLRAGPFQCALVGATAVLTAPGLHYGVGAKPYADDNTLEAFDRLAARLDEYFIANHRSPEGVNLVFLAHAIPSVFGFEHVSYRGAGRLAARLAVMATKRPVTLIGGHVHAEFIDTFEGGYSSFSLVNDKWHAFDLNRDGTYSITFKEGGE